MRTSDYEDVKAFARGCMWTYMVLKERTARPNADPEIQAILEEVNVRDSGLSRLNKKSSSRGAKKLLDAPVDRVELAAAARLPYERLDQLTMDLPMRVR